MVSKRGGKMEQFFELYNRDFDLSEIVAINQFWQKTNSFSMRKPRSNNALLFFVGCSAVFRRRDSAVCHDIPKGSLFFVPEGACYDWTFCDIDNDGVSTMLFEFALTDKYGKRIRMNGSEGLIETNEETVKALFNMLIYEFSRPRQIPVRIKNAAYGLLSHVLDGCRKETVDDNVRCIYKGIRYLEDDPKQNMTVSELADMCNVSTNYFERLFKEYAGCSPNAYKIKKKMERAKLLLSVSDMTVRQISYETGFDDTAYFCRAFKKHFGITPTQMRKARS